MTEGSQPINVVANMHGYCSNLSIVSENEACGLTKREYFAAIRKEPIFGNETMSESWAQIIMGGKCPTGPSIENIQWWVSAHEKFSVMRADALIEELNKQK